MTIQKQLTMTPKQLILNQNISSKGNDIKVTPERLRLNATRLGCYPFAKQGIYSVTKAR